MRASRGRDLLGALLAAAVAVVACGSSATGSRCAAAGGVCLGASFDACFAEAPASANDCATTSTGAATSCCTDMNGPAAPQPDAGHDAHARRIDAGRPPALGGHDAGHDAPATPPADATPDVGVTTPPIDAAANTWTFTKIPGTACLDGSETGFALNPAPTPTDDLIIFLEGGGACWDGTSCWGPVSTSFYVATGYGEAEFATDPQVDLWVLDRNQSSNPFKAMNMAFIPYCTGDVLAGNSVTTLSYLGNSYPTHFVGWENVTIFLRSIVKAYPNARNVWLVGDSAGGFGTALQWGRVQQAFPDARVQVLDDSGQPIEPAAGRWPMWASTWNLELPADCPACKTDPGAFAAYYSAKYPSQRFGLLSYQDDIVISPFMDISLTQFSTELQGLEAQMDSSWPNGKYFVISGSGHVGLLIAGADTAMQSWITDLVTGSASWASSKP